MKIRRPNGRRFLALCAVLAIVTVLWNVACVTVIKTRTGAAEDSSVAEATKLLAYYRTYADAAADGLSLNSHRDLVSDFWENSMSRITQGDQIRHSMLMGYHEGITAVPGEEDTVSAHERAPYTLAVFLVRCDELLADGVPVSSGVLPDSAGVRTYGYRLSVEQAVCLDSSLGSVTTLTASSSIRPNGAPLMEVGGRYLVWGECLISEDGSHVLTLTDHDELAQDRTVRVRGDTVVYEAVGQMPICSEIHGSLDDFYNTENGKLWQESVLQMCKVSYQSLRVTAVQSMQYLVAVRDGGVMLTQGRMIDEHDHAKKSRVCLVSDEAAQINGWSLGDTISFSFYSSEYNVSEFSSAPIPSGFDPYRGFREEGVYEIVGIYHSEGWAGNEYGIHPSTVLIPKDSLQNLYYQNIVSSLVYTCKPDDLSFLKGELRDLRLLNTFSFVETLGESPMPEEYNEKALRDTGNIVLAVCWLVLAVHPILIHLRQYGLERFGVNVKDIVPYVCRRLRRDPWSGAFSVLLVALVAFLMLMVQSRLVYQQEEMENTYDEYPIMCTVSNATGTQTDYLKIPPRIYQLCTDTGSILYPYVKNVQLLTRFTPVGQYIPYVAEDGTPDEKLMEGVQLVGINCLEADERISADSVIFFSGYSEADLMSDAMVCLVARSEEEIPDSIDFQVNARNRVTLTVIGTYSPTRTQQVFCPFETLCRWNEDVKKTPYAERLCFMVADTRELNACKDVLSKYFVEVNVKNASTESDVLAIVIDDALFAESIYVLQRSIMLFRLMLITLCILSVGISFFAAFLTVRARKMELAIMCSLGKGSAAVFMTVMLEHMVFFGVGVIMAGLLYSVIFASMPSLTYLTIFLLCYMVGVSIAILQTTRGRIMQVLKGNE